MIEKGDNATLLQAIVTHLSGVAQARGMSEETAKQIWDAFGDAFEGFTKEQEAKLAEQLYELFGEAGWGQEEVPLGRRFPLLSELSEAHEEENEAEGINYVIFVEGMFGVLQEKGILEGSSSALTPSGKEKFRALTKTGWKPDLTKLIWELQTCDNIPKDEAMIRHVAELMIEEIDELWKGDLP